MNECLVNICEAFEETTDFFSNRSLEKEEIVTKLFFDFLECFSSLKAEKPATVSTNSTRSDNLFIFYLFLIIFYVL